MLILADGGGSNGWRCRSWKKALQDRISDRFGLTVTVSHYPPGTSKLEPHRAPLVQPHLLKLGRSASDRYGNHAQLRTTKTL
jgi:hypothetical protein